MIEHAVTGAARHKKIGGSELAALCGLASYGTRPIDVYRRIVLGISGFTGSRYSDRGTREEPRVRALYLSTYKLKQKEHPGTIYFEDCFAGNVDDLIADRAGQVFPVDYKTSSNSPGSLKKWGPSGTQIYPSQYRVQLALYMAMGGWPFSQLFCALGTDENDAQGDDAKIFTITDTRLYTLKRDIPFENKILNAGRVFWKNHVVPKIAPVDLNSKAVLEMKLTREELEMANVEPEAMDLFDLELPKSVADQLSEPAQAAERKMPPIQVETPAEADAAKKAFEEKQRKLEEDKKKNLLQAAPTRLVDDAVRGQRYLHDGALVEFNCSLSTASGSRFFSFQPIAGGSPILLPPGTVIQNLADVLPPDAPKSDPALASEPLPAGEEKPKRKRRTKEEMAADAALEADVKAKEALKATQSAVVMVDGAKINFGTASPGTFSGTATPPPPAPAVPFRLFLDCLPTGPMQVQSLDAFVAKSVAACCKACGVADLRIHAEKDNALAYGKWKGTLANWVRENPPEAGTYYLITGGSELAQVIGEALGPVVKGVK